MEKYSRNTQIIDGELDNNQVMLHLEKGKYFGLNSVGKRIWDMIEQPTSFEEIIAVLLSEFDVSESQCSQEAKTFLDKAVQYDVIKKSEFSI